MTSTSALWLCLLGVAVLPARMPVVPTQVRHWALEGSVAAGHCQSIKGAVMHLVAGDPSAQCLRHGFMLHTKYQVVYPFPTFQPAFQLKKDQVVLLNTSYSLVACAVSVHSAGRPRPGSPVSLHRANQETWLGVGEAGASVPCPSHSTVH